MNEAIIEAMMILSGVFMTAGAVGLFRFRDFYLKIHSATMITVGGVIFSLMLLAIEATPLMIRFKLMALIVLMLLTSPVSSHFIALAACKGRIKMEIKERVIKK